MSLLAAFNRQREGVRCKLCRLTVPANQVQRHKDTCKASVPEEEECEVLSEHEADPDVTRVSPVRKPRAPDSRKRPLRSDVNGDAEAADEPASSLADTYHIRVFRRITESGFQRGEKQRIWSEDDRHIWNTWTGEQFNDVCRHVFVRVFVRVTGKWHSAEALGRALDCASVRPALDTLNRHGFLECSSGVNGFKCLSDVLPLLSAPQLRELAKVYHLKSVNSKVASKAELSEALRRHALQKNVFGQTIECSVVKKCVSVLGTYLRVPASIERLFVCLFCLYSPVDMNSSQLINSPQLNLKSQLMNTVRAAEKGEQKFPLWERVTADADCPIFASNREWNELVLSVYVYLIYIDAHAAERQIAVHLLRQEWTKIWMLSESLRAKVTASQSHILTELECRPPHLRQYSAEHVLTRCLWHAVEAAQRLRVYTQAVELLDFLLTWPGGRCLCVDYVGRWFERLALNQHIHLKQPAQAFWTIERAFGHGGVSAQSLLALWDRATKVRPKLESPPDDQQLCGAFRNYVPPAEPEPYELVARTMGKELGEGERKNVFVDETGAPVSVEQVALAHYKQQMAFADGQHCEGACWHALLGLLLWDVIHDYDAQLQHHTWLSPVQTQPLDLNHTADRPAFARTAAYTERLQWLRAADASSLRAQVCIAWQYNFEVCSTFVAWDRFESLDSLADLAVCAGGDRLATLFDYMLDNFRFRRSGFPDLTLWDVKQGKFMVVEVKGPGDKLSTKQRIWLHWFSTAVGAQAQVCHVLAENRKLLGGDDD